MFVDLVFMITITFLCLLLLLCNECSASNSARKFAKSEDNIVHQTKYFEPCDNNKTIAKQLLRWRNNENFQYYIPRTSCLTCYKEPCLDNCENATYSSPNMTVYNNLFEFGLFTFNIPKECYFLLIINSACFLKVSVEPNYNDDEITIGIYECDMPLVHGNSCSMYDLNITTIKDVEFQRECLFFAFAFVEENKVHYSISYDCTYIPSTLLKENTSLELDKCYFDANNEKEERFVQFHYTINRSRTPDGVSLLLPCSSGGYLVSNNTGRFLFGDACKDVVRDNNTMEGFEFIIKNIFNNKEDWKFPTRETPVTNAHESRIPIYVADGGEWKTVVEMKPIKKEIPEMKNKVRKGCDYVDPKSEIQNSTKPPATLVQQETVPPNKQVENKKKEKKVQNLNSTNDISMGSYIYLCTKLLKIILIIDLGLIFLF